LLTSVKNTQTNPPNRFCVFLAPLVGVHLKQTMSRIEKIWTDLKDLTTDAQVLSYWENRQTRILANLKTANSDFDTVTNIIHRLEKSVNAANL